MSPIRCGSGQEQDPRLGYQAKTRPDSDRAYPSRTELEPEPAAAAGAAQRKLSCTHADAGPVTELPSQAGPEPEPEPDAANPSRTGQEPTRPVPGGPGSEPSTLRAGAGQDVSESDGRSAAKCVFERESKLSGERNNFADRHCG